MRIFPRSHDNFLMGPSTSLHTTHKSKYLHAQLWSTSQRSLCGNFFYPRSKCRSSQGSGSCLAAEQVISTCLVSSPSLEVPSAKVCWPCCSWERYRGIILNRPAPNQRTCVKFGRGVFWLVPLPLFLKSSLIYLFPPVWLNLPVNLYCFIRFFLALLTWLLDGVNGFRSQSNWFYSSAFGL